MLQLCARSPFLAQRLQRHPLLLDDLIDPLLSADLASDLSDLQRRLQTSLPMSLDLETLLHKLQQWQQSYQLRIAINAVFDSITTAQAQQQLSWLAEALVGQLLQRCQHDLGADIDLSVIAYGSLGAGEMHFASDLDLIFLYRPQGDRIAQERQATRLAQKLIHWLTTSAPHERLYAIDTRLRPNGNSGTLISSFAAFADYQQRHAWVWEWQALSRARCIAGNAKAKQHFADIRWQCLHPVREQRQISQQIRAMFERLQRQHRWDALTACRTRIAFLCQYWLLTLELPAGPVPTSTSAQLQYLGNTAAALHTDCQQLQQLWARLQDLQQQRQLSNSSATLEQTTIDACASLWAAHLQR